MYDKTSKITEITEITAKTTLSVIPVGGTLITCVWDSIKANCAQRRLDDWKQLMENRLNKVEDTLKEVGNNECFTTAMMKATDSAIKTMEKEKRVFLADAVINSLTSEIGESIMMIYFELIDKFTIWHIKILDFFENPKKFPIVIENNYRCGTPIDSLISVYPELGEKREIVDKIIKDLHDDGLINTENLHITMSGSGMVASRTTNLGNDFIKFLTAKRIENK